MKGLRLFRFFALLALLSACRMVPEGDAVAKRETAGGVSVVAVQYVVSVGNVGAETVEVLLRNGTGKQVSFVRAELDGTELPPLKPTAQRR